jgi:2-oxoglutarate dehydrogenase E2 component (dihydrolipoamide succinyltransferase)
MVQVVLERENVNDEFVAIKKLFKRNNDLVVKDEIILEVETSKTITEVCAPEHGTLRIALAEGDEIAVNEVLFEVEAPQSAAVPAVSPSVVSPSLVSPSVVSPSVVSPSVVSPSVVSPSVVDNAATVEGSASSPAAGDDQELSRAALKVAAALKIDLRRLNQGWITAADVRATSRNDSPRSSPPPAPRPALDPPESDGTRALPKVPFRRATISIGKRAEARNLSHANSDGNVSMIGIDIVPAGPRLVPQAFLFQDSITDLVVFEASRLLRIYPDLNAFRIDDRSIGYYEEVNFGISFDSGHNLKVLALRRADMLSLSQVQSGIEELLHIYESGIAIESDMLTTSTITVSDLSRSPVTFMLPLLSSNQSLILGIARGAAGGFMVYASFDHRVSEGLQVARFLADLKERVQSYYRDEAEIKDPKALRCSACDRSIQDEVDAGRRGLMRMSFPDGSDGHLCRICFEGL